MLNQEYVQELFRYDVATGELFWRESQGHTRSGMIAGTPNQGYLRVGIDRKIYFVHRIIFLYCHGYLPEHQIDHIDKNKSNNRIDNLREATNQCNQRNVGNPKDNSSGVKGVCWSKQFKKWEAQIGVNNNKISIGRFNKFCDAVRARYNKEKQLKWSGCDISSPAFLYLQERNLLS